MRSDLTEAERALWHALRAKRLGGLKFRRQIPVGPFIADFLCADAKLIVEVDGGQHAGAGAKVDARRTKQLEQLGYGVLRFWNGDVLSNLPGVLDAILAEAGSPLSPALSPRGERGQDKDL